MSVRGQRIASPYGTRDQVPGEVALVAVVLLAALLWVPRDRWVGDRASAAPAPSAADTAAVGR